MKRIFLILSLIVFSIGILKSNTQNQKLNKNDAFYLLEKESFNVDFFNFI